MKREVKVRFEIDKPEACVHAHLGQEPMREQEIKNLILNELKRYFHIMTDQEIRESIQNYKSVKDKEKRARKMRDRDPPPTDYNREVINKFGTRQKAMKSITKEIQRKASEKYGIEGEKRIKGTNFRIDLFDEEERVCYEIALGDGAEIWKDIVKALVVDAEKLVIFGRSYPNPWGMVGYDYMKRHWEALMDKIKLEVEIIEFMSDRISR